MARTSSVNDENDWRIHPATQELVSVAFGAAARVAVRFGLSAEQAGELMTAAWHIVQDKKTPSAIAVAVSDSSDAETNDGEETRPV
jgi:hypothetical protein